PPSVDSSPSSVRPRSPPRSARHRTARARPGSVRRPQPHPCSASLASTPPPGRHARKCGRTEHESAYPGTAWPRSTAVVGVVALCRRACCTRRGCWADSRPCPHAYLRLRHDHRRGPFLRPRCVARPSSVLLPPRTPAEQRSTSPSAYTRRLAATTAAQTGLSSSATFLDRVPLPVPREDPTGFLLRSLARRTWPSP